MLVRFNDVIEALELAAAECTHYLNRNTGEIVMITNEELEAAEEDDLISQYPDWQREAILKAREILKCENIVELPNQFDIHEYQIMEDFCMAFRDRHVSEDLCRLIKGSGAFRRFKQAIYAIGAEKEWYQFRRAEIEKIAIHWLEENEVTYSRDDSTNDVERPI